MMINKKKLSAFIVVVILLILGIIIYFKGTEFMPFFMEQNSSKVKQIERVDDEVSFALPHTIATGSATLKNGKKVYVDCEMVSGEYLPERKIGLMTYSPEYHGEFLLKVYSDKSKKDDSLVFVSEPYTQTYEDNFILEFSDINNDKNLDLCLQIMDNGIYDRRYKIMTILDEGRIKPISDELSLNEYTPCYMIERIDNKEAAEIWKRAGLITQTGLSYGDINDSDVNLIVFNEYPPKIYYIWNPVIEKFEYLCGDEYGDYPIYDHYIQKNTFLSLKKLSIDDSEGKTANEELLNDIFDKYYTMAKVGGAYDDYQNTVEIKSNYKQYELNKENIIEKYNSKININMYDKGACSIDGIYPKITGMLIMNGNNKKEDDFFYNGRAKKIKVIINNEKEYILDLKDSKEAQLIDLEYQQSMEGPTNIEIEVIDMYEGKENQDVYISDIQFGLDSQGKSNYDIELLKTNSSKIYPKWIRKFIGFDNDNQCVYSDDGEFFGWKENFWGGCSSWCSVSEYSNEVTASSTLKSHGKFSYSPENVSNEERGNSWVEGVDGDGIGEYIEITQACLVRDEKYETDIGFTELCIVNGYAATEKNWKENNRIKELKMYFADEYIGTIVLEDTIYPQYIDISSLNLKVANGEKAKFRFEIADVYNGEKYEDTCLTGLLIEFSGRTGH